MTVELNDSLELIYDLEKAKQRIEELEKSESQFRSFLTNLQLISVILDRKACITYCSKFLLDLTGYSIDEVLGNNWFDLFIPSDIREKIRQIFLTSIQTKDFPLVYENEILTKSGEIKLIKWRNSILKDNFENVIGAASIGEDITIYKKTEEELKDSEERYKALANATSEAIIISLDGICIETNNNAPDMFAYEYFELIGKPVTEFVADQFRESIVNKMLFEFQEPYEALAQRKDGSKFLAVFHGKNFNYKGEKVRVTTVRDISKRKAAEEKLRKSEERLKSIFYAAENVAFIMSDIQKDDPKVVEFSPGAEKIFGYKREEVLGKQIRIFHRPEDVQNFPEIFASMEKNKVGFSGETVLLRKNGEEFPALLTIYPIFDYNNIMVAGIGVSIDISELKKTESALRESELRYKQLVELSPDAIVVHKNGIIVYANKSALTLINGDSENGLIGKRALDFVHPDYRLAALERISESIKNDVTAPMIEEKFIDFAGRIIDVEVIGIPVIFDSEKAMQVIIRDISGRKQSEKVVMESEEKYRTLFETMTQGVVYQNFAGNIISANSAAEKILGISLEQMQGLKAIDPNWNIVHEDGSNYPASDHPSMIALKTGKKISNVIMGVYLPKNNKLRWINVTAVPQFINGSESPNQVYTTLEDMTERREALLAVEESEKKYRSIFSTMNDALFIIDFDGTILDANPAALRLYGYEYSEILKLHTSQVVTEGYHDIFKDMINEVIDNGYFHYETIDQKKDGSTFYADVISSKILFHGKFNLLTIIRDVTDNKIASKTLEESEQKFRALFENMAGGFALHQIVIDDYGYPIDYIFLEANRSFSKLTGLDNKAIVGKRVTEILPGIENDEFNWIKKYGDVAISGESIFFEQYSNHLNKWYSVIAYRPGESQFAVIIHDITEQKKIEIKIKEINEELETKVKDRTAQLEDAMKELSIENDKRKQIQDDLIRYQGELRESLENEKELSKLKSAFMSMVSHQYRTPLTVIHSSAELLRRYKDNGNHEKHEKHIINIINSVDRMTEMLEKIMLIGKYDIEDNELNKAPVNINEVIYLAIEELKVYDNDSHNIIFKFDNTETIIISEKFFLEQIMNNLLSNAVKYSKAGTEILVESFEREDYIRINIKDQGIGIPESDIKHIYDHFYRGSNVENIYGTGLGLSIVKRFVNRLNGEFIVETEEGRGTTVSILLPVKFDI